MADPLSEILSLLKPRSYITAGFNAGGDWSLRLDDLAGRIKCYAVMRGAFWLLLEEGGEPIQLVTGDCFVLPSGRAVRIGSDLSLEPKLASEVLAPDRDGEVVTFNGGGDVLLGGSRFEVSDNHVEVLLRTLPPVIHLKAATEQETLRWSIDLMMREMREGRPGWSLISQQLAHIMLAQTLRLYLAQEENVGHGWFAGLADPPIGTALGEIHADPARDWTLEELAGTAGMSRTVFAKRFRERVGDTPLAYVARWRMMLAAERLAAGRETLAQIARAVGYGSENAFNTAFRRVMGVAPRRYGRSANETKKREV